VGKSRRAGVSGQVRKTRSRPSRALRARTSRRKSATTHVNSGAIDSREAVIETVKKFFGPRGRKIPPDPPEWFVTLTFRNPKTTSQGAPSALKLWLSRYNQRNPLGRFRLVCWSVELQRRGTAHIHALMAGGQQISNGHCDKCIAGLSCRSEPYQVHKESWNHHHGFSRWYPYDDSIGCGGVTYVLKYILSDECEGWGLWEAGKDF